MKTQTTAQSSIETRRRAFRPEQELLLCCAATSLDDERQAHLRALLEEEINWPYLIDLAERHRLMPLLYVHLQSVPPGVVPVVQLRLLEDRFRKNLISNLLLTSELRSLLDLFEASGIRAIPFKGPTLAVAAYGDIGLRQFNDIDILLPRRDVLKARRLLIEHGYKPEHPLTRAQEAACLQSECEFAFRRAAYIEIQWEIVPANYAFKINDNLLWQRAQRIEIEGASLPALSPEDLLLILCAHGTKHSWERLAWICDIAEWVRAALHLDWHGLFARAERLGGARMLWLGLFLANDLLGAALPGDVMKKVEADGVVKHLGAQVCERLFGDSRSSHQVIKDSLFYIRARERASDRARCRLRMATAPTINDFECLHLPRPFFPLYYPLRPARLMAQYGLRLLNRIFA